MCNPDILPQGKIKKYREELLEEQGYLCDLCGLPCIRPQLDHHHASYDNDFEFGASQVRGAICASCNTRLAGIENIKRVKFEHADLYEWLGNAREYIKKYRDEPSGVIHNTERSRLNKLKNYK